MGGIGGTVILGRDPPPPVPPMNIAGAPPAPALLMMNTCGADRGGPARRWAGTRPRRPALPALEPAGLPVQAASRQAAARVAAQQAAALPRAGLMTWLPRAPALCGAPPTRLTPPFWAAPSSRQAVLSGAGRRRAPTGWPAARDTARPVGPQRRLRPGPRSRSAG